ncbi:hypothetical protein BLNAU_11734 [Blattamonas nauphoetae]|uniref:Uncharacterized protein n=1 Tax=Blattamonas nauphoetae TaxID=2049346 RepID=A0ABQ9XLG4_9EUKA|nr:hypothetical protein BLNAU_11734 [Blattamonas nauphoetae]
MDCSPFLEWDEEELESTEEQAVVFLSLIATLKIQRALNDSLEAKAVKFIESVNLNDEESADAFLESLVPFSGDSQGDFVQSIVVLLSSASHVVTRTAMKLIEALIRNCSIEVLLALVQAGLIPQLIITLNPQSLPFAEAVDIHTSLITRIDDSVWLATRAGLAYLTNEEGNAQQDVHETNDHSIWCFLNSMMDTQRDWNEKRGEFRQMWKRVHRMLRMEGIEDAIEEKLRNDQNTFYGGRIVSNSIGWNHLLVFLDGCRPLLQPSSHPPSTFWISLARQLTLPQTILTARKVLSPDPWAFSIPAQTPSTPSHSPLPLRRHPHSPTPLCLYPHHAHPPTPLCLYPHHAHPPTPLCLSLTTHTLPLPSASPSPPSHSPLPLPHHAHPPTPLCLSLTTHTLPLPSASPSPRTPSHSPLPLPHHPHPPTSFCLSPHHPRPPTPLCLSLTTHTLPLPSASPPTSLILAHIDDCRSKHSQHPHRLSPPFAFFESSSRHPLFPPPLLQPQCDHSAITSLMTCQN